MKKNNIVAYTAILISVISLIYILNIKQSYSLKNFYNSAVKSGFSGNEQEWLQMMSGETIADGEDGKTPVKGIDYFDGIDGTDGAPGPKGETGAQGIAGINGEIGAQGLTGPQGNPGIDGTNGTNGIDGADGSDGATGPQGDPGISINNDVITDGVTDTLMTGLLKGNGAKIVQAVADVDYLTPGLAASTYLNSVDASTEYLKIDASNGPITGDLIIQPSTNSTTSFVVKDQAGNIVMSVDTLNNKINLGNSTSTFDLLGAARFGDSNNYTAFASNGFMRMSGGAKAWDDLRVQILTRPSAGQPTFSSGFAGNANLYTYNFDGNNSLNNVFFEAQLPHAWDGSTIYPHIHWAPTTNATGNVDWYLEYAWVDYQGDFSTAANKGTIMLSDTVSTASIWKHMIAKNATGLVPNINQSKISSMLICRLYRDPSLAGDTLSAPVALVSIDFHYRIDTLGSSSEYIK